MAVVALWIGTGILKKYHFLQEAHSRKINHMFVFIGGALVFGWTPEEVARINLYVICLSILLLVFIVCQFQDSFPFRYAYLANTRDSDAPHSSFFFWFSWLISILGLAIVDLFFSQIAVTRTAVLIVGLGDGCAELIGRHWGRRFYRIFSWGQISSLRSLEGSLACWSVTLIVMLCCCKPTLGLSSWIISALLMSTIITLVEAISPRNCDNFFLLVSSSALVNLFFLAHWIS
jgi:dolichol kinase